MVEIVVLSPRTPQCHICTARLAFSYTIHSAAAETLLFLTVHHRQFIASLPRLYSYPIRNYLTMNISIEIGVKYFLKWFALFQPFQRVNDNKWTATNAICRWPYLKSNFLFRYLAQIWFTTDMECAAWAFYIWVQCFLLYLQK